MFRLARWTLFGLIVHVIGLALIILAWYMDANFVNAVWEFNERLSQKTARALDSSGRLVSFFKFMHVDKSLFLAEVSALVLGVFLTLRSAYHRTVHGHDLV